MSSRNKGTLSKAGSTLAYGAGSYVKKLNLIYAERMQDAAREIRTFASSKIQRAKSKGGEYPGTVTGAMAAGYRSKVVPIRTGYEIQAWNIAPHSVIMQNGSVGGQIIRPKKAKCLSFLINGKRIFAKSVIRGHIAPRPHLTLLTKDFMPRFKAIVCKPIKI
jgi:hypothetical protein